MSDDDLLCVVSVCFSVLQRILARMNTSHASMSDWQSLYKVRD